MDVLFGFFPLKLNRVSIAGQMRVIAGSADSTGPWRRAGRRSMAIWQWLTRGLITTLTTITPPSFCTTQRYSRGHSCQICFPTLISLFRDKKPNSAGLYMLFLQLHKYYTSFKNIHNVVSAFSPTKMSFSPAFYCNRRHVNSGK